MKILLTGGSGFIGAWIMRRFLAEHAKIRVFDQSIDKTLADRIIGSASQQIDWFAGDVRSTEAIVKAAEGCDLIIHLAAVLTPACQQDPIAGAEINLIGTLNVFEAARSHGMRSVLYMSSAGVFGPDDGVQPYPTTHYGAFKLAGEGCARAYWQDYGIASVGFRPLVVYGPGREVGLTAGPVLACKAAVQGEAYTIPFSGGSDFVYVDDVAAAFQSAANNHINGARVYNIVGERGSVSKVVEQIKRIIPEARINAEGPELPVCANIDAGTLRDDFSAIPLTSLGQGLQATIEFYRTAV